MKSKKNLIILAIVIAISLFGVAYAFFDYYKLGEIQMISAGSVNLLFNEGDDTIDLSNIFPETVEKARSRDDNFVTFTVSGINTTADQDIYYEIMLNNGDPETGMTRFNPEHLVFDLIELNEDGTEGTYLVNAQSYSDFNEKRIWVNTVDRNTATEVNQTYKLRMWLSENVKISDTNPNANYPSTGYENYYASVKVSVYGDFVEKRIVTGYITYDMSSLGLTNLTSSPIYNSKIGTITTEVPAVSGYKFMGWSTTLDGEVKYNPGDEMDTSDIVNNSLNLYPVVKQLEKLIEKIQNTISLTEADTDCDRFVYGSDVDNNYVWYSGKLWRIVSVNCDGSIKLVTQGNMTTIAWDYSSSNTNYSTSQIHTWLNSEFLPTLYDVDNLLADATWDYRVYTSFPTEKLSSTLLLTEKVGLINIYEYMMTGGTNSSDTTNTFLNNGYYWWLITLMGGKYIWKGAIDGCATSTLQTNPRGVRPSVNLKSGITISGGTGEKNNPYTIDGDKTLGTNSELLSNRISGEYIKFNNTKYRIVGVEEVNGEQLTKVTMADYGINQNTLSTLEKFGSSITYSYLNGIGLYFQNWYDADSTSTTYSSTYISDMYKAMIATSGIKWYTGSTSTSSSVIGNYTKSKTGTTVTTPIGLGYYGEMFSSQFGDGSDVSTDIWLITRYKSTHIWYINSEGRGNVYGQTAQLGARPSFYLKADVKIGDVDGDGDVGTGMPHDPYEIVQ